MLYSMQEVVKKFQISSRTLRYYHQIGLLIPYKTEARHQRYYGKENIKDLTLILELKAAGFSLNEIKLLLDHTDSNKKDSWQFILNKEIDRLKKEILYHQDIIKSLKVKV